MYIEPLLNPPISYKNYVNRKILIILDIENYK